VSRIVGVEIYDVRFPTSRNHDGSDAISRNPGCASAYGIVRTGAPDGLAIHTRLRVQDRQRPTQADCVTLESGSNR
jgi:hypothetical protein